MTPQEKDQRARALGRHIARCNEDERHQVRCGLCRWLLWCPCFETARPTGKHICGHCAKEITCQE